MSVDGKYLALIDSLQIMSSPLSPSSNVSHPDFYALRFNATHTTHKICWSEIRMRFTRLSP